MSKRAKLKCCLDALHNRFAKHGRFTMHNRFNALPIQVSISIQHKPLDTYQQLFYTLRIIADFLHLALILSIIDPSYPRSKTV